MLVAQVLGSLLMNMYDTYVSVIIVKVTISTVQYRYHTYLWAKTQTPVTCDSCLIMIFQHHLKCCQIICFYIKWAPWYFLNNKKMFPIIPITRLRLSFKWILLPATHSRRPPVTVITKEKKPTGIIDCHTYWQTSGNYSGQISLEMFSVVFYLFSQNWGYWL